MLTSSPSALPCTVVIQLRYSDWMSWSLLKKIQIYHCIQFSKTYSKYLSILKFSFCIFVVCNTHTYIPWSPRITSFTFFFYNSSNLTFTGFFLTYFDDGRENGIILLLWNNNIARWRSSEFRSPIINVSDVLSFACMWDVGIV